MEQIVSVISAFFTDAGPGGVVVLSVIVLAAYLLNTHSLDLAG